MVDDSLVFKTSKGQGGGEAKDEKAAVVKSVGKKGSSAKILDKVNIYNGHIGNIKTIEKQAAIELYYSLESDILAWQQIQSSSSPTDDNGDDSEEEYKRIAKAKQVAFRLLGLLLHYQIINPPTSPTAGAILNKKISESMKIVLERCLKLLLSILQASAYPQDQKNYCKVACISTLWILSVQKWPAFVWNATNQAGSLTNCQLILSAIVAILKRNPSIAVHSQALSTLSKLTEIIPPLMRKFASIWLPEIMSLAVTGLASTIRKSSLSLFEKFALSMALQPDTFSAINIPNLVDNLFSVFGSNLLSQLETLGEEQIVLSLVAHLFLLLPLQRANNVKNNNSVNSMLSAFEKGLLSPVPKIADFALDTWKFVIHSSTIFPKKNLKFLVSPICNGLRNADKEEDIERKTVIRNKCLNLWKFVLIVHSEYIFDGKAAEGMDVLFRPVFNMLDESCKAHVLEALIRPIPNNIWDVCYEKNGYQFKMDLLTVASIDAAPLPGTSEVGKSRNHFNDYLPVLDKVTKIHGLFESVGGDLMVKILSPNDAGEITWQKCPITGFDLVSESGANVWGNLMVLLGRLGRRDVNPSLEWKKFISYLVNLIASVVSETEREECDVAVSSKGGFNSDQERLYCVFHYLTELFIDHIPFLLNIKLICGPDEANQPVVLNSPLSNRASCNPSFQSDYMPFFQKLVNLMKRGSGMLDSMRAVIGLISQCGDSNSKYVQDFWQRAASELRLFLEETRIVSEDLETLESPCHSVFHETLTFPFLRTSNGSFSSHESVLKAWESLFKTFYSVCLAQKQQPLNAIDEILDLIKKQQTLVEDEKAAEKSAEFMTAWIRMVSFNYYEAISTFQFESNSGTLRTANVSSSNSLHNSNVSIDDFSFLSGTPFNPPRLFSNFLSILSLNLYNLWTTSGDDGATGIKEVCDCLASLTERVMSSPKCLVYLLVQVFTPALLAVIKKEEESDGGCDKKNKKIFDQFFKICFDGLVESFSGTLSLNVPLRHQIKYDDQELLDRLSPILVFILEQQDCSKGTSNSVVSFWRATFEPMIEKPESLLIVRDERLPILLNLDTIPVDDGGGIDAVIVSPEVQAVNSLSSSLGGLERAAVHPAITHVLSTPSISTSGKGSRHALGTPSFSSPPPSILKRRMIFGGNPNQNMSPLALLSSGGGSCSSGGGGGGGGKRKVRFCGGEEKAAGSKSKAEIGKKREDPDDESSGVADKRSLELKEDANSGSPCTARRKRLKYEKEKWVKNPDVADEEEVVEMEEEDISVNADALADTEMIEVEDEKRNEEKVDEKENGQDKENVEALTITENADANAPTIPNALLTTVLQSLATDSCDRRDLKSILELHSTQDLCTLSKRMNGILGFITNEIVTRCQDPSSGA